MRRYYAILLGIGLVGCRPESPDDALTVFAAASLTDAFTELGALAHTGEPALTVRFNFAGSQILATQIEHGAPADVIASADEDWIAHVVALDLTHRDPVIFAHNEMRIVVPTSNPGTITRPQDLARAGVRVLLASRAVPAGRYGRRLLHALAQRPEYEADYAQSVLSNVVSDEPDVRAVLAKVVLGEADAGIVYATDADQETVSILPVPGQTAVRASYPVLALTERGQRFVDLLRSDAGRRVLRRHGFSTPSTATP